MESAYFKKEASSTHHGFQCIRDVSDSAGVQAAQDQYRVHSGITNEKPGGQPGLNGDPESVSVPLL
jgi:hypothetical protein